MLILFARPMFNVFLGEGQLGVAEQGVPALRLLGPPALPALATIVVLGGALRRAAGPTSPTLVGGRARLCAGSPAFDLPARRSAPAFRPSRGVCWAWTAMFADILVRGVLMAIRFLRGRWTQIRV